MAITTHGKWSDPAVPKNGWICLHVTDLLGAEAECQMCERERLRYMHRMHHQSYEDLEVGCICACHMAQDFVGPPDRERELRNIAARRERWPHRRWDYFGPNKYSTKVGGFRIVVSRWANRATWCFEISNLETGEVERSRKCYSDETSVKLVTFEALLWMQKRDAQRNSRI